MFSIKGRVFFILHCLDDSNLLLQLSFQFVCFTLIGEDENLNIKYILKIYNISINYFFRSVLTTFMNTLCPDCTILNCINNYNLITHT